MMINKRKWRKLIEEFETEVNMIGQFAYRRAAQTGEKLGVTLYYAEDDYGLHIFSVKDEEVGQVIDTVGDKEELVLMIFNGMNLPHGNITHMIKMQLMNCLGEIYQVH